jgi:hypothetical protein
MGLPTPAAALRARVVHLLTILTLAAGYADLARGGLTVAPVLLVAGYVILVPLALLRD